jgi:hypothetical protein
MKMQDSVISPENSFIHFDFVFNKEVCDKRTSKEAQAACIYTSPSALLELVMEVRGKSFQESRAKFLMLSACLESHRRVM